MSAPCVLSVCGLCMVATLALSGAQRHTRTIGVNSETLESKLEPDDEVVLVARTDESGVFTRPPNAREMMRLLVHQSQVVAIVSVDAVHARLVENGTWMYLCFMDLVNAYPSDDGTTRILKASGRPLLIDNGRVKDTWPSDAPERVERPLDGLRLSDVVKQIRRVKP